MRDIQVAVSMLFNIINLLVFARVIMSWVVKDLNNPVSKFIYSVTEPLLLPFREILKKMGVGGMIDFSPILLILTLQFVYSIIIRL